MNVDALKNFAAQILANPNEGKAEYAVKTTWDGQVRAITRPEPFVLGGQACERVFEIATDEPPQLLGSNRGPNPQELLFAALNSCMMVVFVAQASLRGITLESLEIRTAGTLDLRGFVDPSTPVQNPAPATPFFLVKTSDFRRAGTARLKKARYFFPGMPISYLRRSFHAGGHS